MIDFINSQFEFYMTADDGEEARIKAKRNQTFTYYMNMLNRTQTMFDWSGLPETVPQRNLELILQSCGNVCITKVNGDLYAFWGGLGGVPNVYYEPTIYTVSNPALNYSAELEIGKDCIRIRNDATGQGLTPINMRFAKALTENDISMLLMDINYRIDNLISASDDRTAESARQYLDDIITGKLGIISESEFFDGLKVAPGGRTGQNIKDLIEYQQYLKASWFNELGVDANYNMKRERIQADEAEMNKDALLTFVDNMLECRRVACEEVNELYGVEWSVDLAGAWLKEQIEQSVPGVDFDVDEDSNINEIDRAKDPDELVEGATSDNPIADQEDEAPEPSEDVAADQEEEPDTGADVTIDVNVTVEDNTDDTSGEEVNDNEENDTESDNTKLD